MIDVTALGELLIDFSCRETDKDGYPIMEAHPGGAPANFLSPIQKFGLKTNMIAKVGNDAFGKLLLSTLNQNGIGTFGVSLSDDFFTTLAFVTFDENNDREFSFARKPGADTQLSKEDLPISLIGTSKVLHIGTLSLTNEPSKSATESAVLYAKHNNVLISFDPNLRKPLWKDLDKAREAMLWGLKNADIVKISDEEIDFLFGKRDYEECAKQLIKKFDIKLIYITMGRNGCIAVNQNGSAFDPGFMELPTIDTTGAGDIFGGSAMWKLLSTNKNPEDLNKEELLNIIRFAGAAAGLSTTKSGGISSTPALDEVISLINY